jgi:esterase/lipase superfamily enzyme
VSFGDAARRAAQIAWDIKFTGVPIFYSWPSKARVRSYMADENSSSISVPHFRRFLELLCERSGAATVHIVAHSMGNRIVCDALHDLSNRTMSNVRVNHLILAAADIDGMRFKEMAESLKLISRRITMYQSSRDRALAISKTVHEKPRAGQPLLILDGMDTVDASNVDTDFLGHSYFGDKLQLLTDINSIILDNKVAQERVLLETASSNDGVYFRFKDT